MELSALTALSPLDGRYASKTAALRPIMSEFGLIKYRVITEIAWILHLSDQKKIKEAAKLRGDDRAFIQNIADSFTEADALAIKKIEQTTNHDVKAVEYFIRDCLAQRESLQALIPFIHFACTSEDINNTAYSLMLRDARREVLQPLLEQVIAAVRAKAEQYATLPMLSKTHGQPASPTTLGKEFLNVAERLQLMANDIITAPIRAKFNGAVGNFNAHYAAYPELNWPVIACNFIESLDLQYNPHTTQIEPHDQIAVLLQAISRFNTVLIDFSRDCWRYISIGYFSQRQVANEVGSSTMPHKVNPIDFENAEGNLGLANALASHLALKLPLSRWQRDLTDSTTLRNLSLVFGYSSLAAQALLKGLSKIDANEPVIQQELNQHWEVLGEAVQTVMRRYGHADAYEQLKSLTRGKVLTQAMLIEFVDRIDIPDEAKVRLRALTPADYLGCAVALVREGT